jgi:hypothetical protein
MTGCPDEKGQERLPIASQKRYLPHINLLRGCGDRVMRMFIGVPMALGTIILIGGCSTDQMQMQTTEQTQAQAQAPQAGSVESAMARQQVTVYDTIPPNGAPLEQLTATACDGTRAAATDKLIAMASQRGGNGIAQVSCKDEGISWACWSSATCTGLALNVTIPPVKRAEPPKRQKAKVEKRTSG